MKISFVIPAYNEEAYIPLCLDALIKEIGTRTDCEIIVVDNNSVDKTREVAEGYKQVKVISESRKGANSAREAGFLISTGELVAFLDADTEVTPGWIARAEREFNHDKNLVCLSGPFIYYDLPPGIQALVKLFYGISYLVYIVNNFILRNTSVIQGGSEIVRRDALEKAGGHNVSLTFYGDDADLAQRLSRVGKVKFSFGFPIRSSGRRLAKEGTFTMGLRYTLNYFWITFFHKPFTTTSRIIRSKESTMPYDPENKTKEWALAALVIVVVLLLLEGALYLLYRLHL
jgi:glycosyltransferase involved in cell wall biosynthesis